MFLLEVRAELDGFGVGVSGERELVDELLLVHVAESEVKLDFLEGFAHVALVVADGLPLEREAVVIGDLDLLDRAFERLDKLLADHILFVVDVFHLVEAVLFPLDVFVLLDDDAPDRLDGFTVVGDGVFEGDSEHVVHLGHVDALVGAAHDYFADAVRHVLLSFTLIRSLCYLN